MTRIVTCLVALGLSVLLGGCKSDCGVICDQRKQCYSADLDVEDCTNKCEGDSKADADYASKAQECSECVESKTCAEALKFCLDDCFGV